MPTNSFTFDAMTGKCSDGYLHINSKHPKVLIIGPNQEQDHIKTCASNPPQKIYDNRIFRSDLEHNRLVEVSDPKMVILYVKNCHRIITKTTGIKIIGQFKALIKIPQGGQLQINNGRKKWLVQLPNNSLRVLVEPFKP